MGAQEAKVGDHRIVNANQRTHSSSPSIMSSYGGHKGGVTCVKFRPLMKHLVSGGSDGSVLMWGLFCRSSIARHHTQIRPYRFLGHLGGICAVAVSPLDTVVASASRDKTVRLWVPSAEGKSTVIRAHSSTVRTVAFSPDGECLLSGGDDKALKIWDVETERFLTGLSGHMNWVRSAEFHSSGRLIVSGGDDKTIRLWDVERHECVHIFSDVSGLVSCTRFHPHGSCIGSSSGQAVQVWDIRSKMLIQHYAGNAGTVRSFCFHPSGNFLLSTCDDATLKIWDLREGKILNTIKGHEGATTCAEFSPAGDHFASGSQDEQVMLWQSNLKQVRKPFVLGCSLQDVSCFAPNSDQITSQNEKSSSDGSKKDSFLSDTVPFLSQVTREITKDGQAIEDAQEQQAKEFQKDAQEQQMKEFQKDAQEQHIEGSQKDAQEQVKEGFQKDDEEQNIEDFQEDVPKQHIQKIQDESMKEPHQNIGSGPDALSLFSTELIHSNQDSSSNLDLQESQALEVTLEHLINQMSTLTKTISVFGERLSHIEDKVLKLEKLGIKS